MFWPRQGKFVQTKSTLFPNRYQSFSKFHVFLGKNGFLAQKRPSLAQNWPIIGLFGPFDPMPDPLGA